MSKSYLVVSVMVDDDDTPSRDLIDIADDIIQAKIEGIVSVQAAREDSALGYSVYITSGPEYFGDI